MTDQIFQGGKSQIFDDKPMTTENRSNPQSLDVMDKDYRGL